MKKKMFLLVFALVVSSAVLQVSSAFVTMGMANESAETAVGPSGYIKIGRSNLRTSKEMLAAEAARVPTGEKSVEVQRPPRYTEVHPPLATGNREAVSTSGPLAVPVINGSTNFDGASQAGWIPPDTHGAMGKNHFVEVTNLNYDVFLRDGTRVRTLALGSFLGTTEGLSDPRVVYDKTWNRWVITVLGLPASATVQHLFIAVSKTDDPEGDFFVYRSFDLNFNNNDDFADYPQLGMDQDAIIITQATFALPATRRDSRIICIPKARIYNGLSPLDPSVAPVFAGLIGTTIAPPIVLDANKSTFCIAAPPSGTTITKYTLQHTSRSAPTISTSFITVGSYSMPPLATQPGTASLLDTLDSRFVNASTQNGNSLWNIHSINAGGLPGLRFYEFNTVANTVIQTGDIFSGASNDFNASIAVNNSNDAFVTWTSTNTVPTTNAEVRFSGRLHTDPLGVIGFGSALFTSPTFYDPTASNPERWGDYSAVSIDPRNQLKAWIVNEKINTTTLWGSRIGKIGF